MKPLLHPAVLLLAVAGACADPVAPAVSAAPAAPAPPAGGAAVVPATPVDGDVVPGRWIVRLADAPAAVGTRGRRAVRLDGPAFRGYAADLSDDEVAALRRDLAVTAVEPDRVIRGSMTGAAARAASWGLDRMDQRTLPLSGTYASDATGAGVDVYLFDSGIALGHAEFGGRAVAGPDYVASGGAAVDCHGHGTHVAGIVGGATYGAAPDTRLVSVRVLDCALRGSTSSAIAGLNWVVAQRRARPQVPAVVNLSFDVGGASSSLDRAVGQAIAAGVTVVAAAGNAARDACAVSPARVAAVLTVAASDETDALAAYSNRGPCIDLVAPGSRITSAWVGAPTTAAIASGTSMAAPHVAGAAALFLSRHPLASPAQVSAALRSAATVGVVRGASAAATPDRLLFAGVAADGDAH